MSIDPTQSMWQRVVDEVTTHDLPSAAQHDFFEPDVNRVELVKEALRKPDGNSRAAAVALLKKMIAAEQMQLFPELIQLARAAHGLIGVVRDIIQALPREWVLAHIDAEVDPILQREEYDDFWMFLELFARLDVTRAVHLARRLAVHVDDDVRELGLLHLSALVARAAGEGEEANVIRVAPGPE